MKEKDFTILSGYIERHAVMSLNKLFNYFNENEALNRNDFQHIIVNSALKLLPEGAGGDEE